MRYTSSLRSCRPSVYHTKMGESRQVPFPTAQVNLPACSPDCPFNAERQYIYHFMKYFVNIYIFMKYKIRPEPSCFGITSLISDNNQGGPYRKPHNKVTQSGVWAFNTVKRRIAVAKEKNNRQMELAGLISRKPKKTL